MQRACMGKPNERCAFPLRCINVNISFYGTHFRRLFSSVSLGKSKWYKLYATAFQHTFHTLIVISYPYMNKNKKKCSASSLYICVNQASKCLPTCKNHVIFWLFSIQINLRLFWVTRHFKIGWKPVLPASLHFPTSSIQRSYILCNSVRTLWYKLAAILINFCSCIVCTKRFSYW